MDLQAKKTALRMISHGLYLLTTNHEGRLNASSISWLSQSSFDPPLVMVAVKADSQTHEMVEASGQFAINLLTVDQTEMTQAFFRPAHLEDDKLNGYVFELGRSQMHPYFSTPLPGLNAK